MNTPRMLTLEFKTELTSEQKELVAQYLERLRIFWNIGIEAIEQLEVFKGWAQSRGVFKKHVDKMNNLLLPCCPLPWKYYPHHINKEGQLAKSGNLIFAPYCQLLPDKARWYQKQVKRVKVPTPAEKKDSWGWVEGVGYACPIGEDYRQPLIENASSVSTQGLYRLISKVGLKPAIASYLRLPLADAKVSELHDYLEIVPSKFRVSVMAELDKAYKAYRSNKGNKELNRGKPRKKGKRDKLVSLIHNNPVGVIVPDPKSKNTLRGVPKIGKVKLDRKFEKRWRNPDGSIPDVRVFKLCVRPDGVFCQLTGNIVRSTKTKPKQGICALDPGLYRYITLDDGTTYENPKFLRKSLHKLAKLQQQLDDKLNQRVILWLHHPQREVEDLQKLCRNISHQKGVLLMCAKSEQEIIEIAGTSINQALKHRLPESAKVRSLKLKISKLHGKVRQQRSKHAHKVSTFLVRNYKVIVGENGLQSHELRKKVEPAFDVDGKYAHNGAMIQSRFTRSFSDAAHGMLLQMLETKAAAANRVFIRFPEKHTTQTCPVCFHLQDIKLGERWFKCDNCEWECDRDQKAAIYMLVKLLEDGTISETGLSKPARETWKLRQAWVAKEEDSKNQL